MPAACEEPKRRSENGGAMLKEHGPKMIGGRSIMRSCVDGWLRATEQDESVNSEGYSQWHRGSNVQA